MTPPLDDDLRQTEGFKNVSLGNVLAVAYATKREKLTFLEEEDKVALGAQYSPGWGAHIHPGGWGDHETVGGW